MRQIFIVRGHKELGATILDKRLETLRFLEEFRVSDEADENL